MQISFIFMIICSIPVASALSENLHSLYEFQIYFEATYKLVAKHFEIEKYRNIKNIHYFLYLSTSPKIVCFLVI